MGYRARRLGRSCVAARACKLTFEIREGINQLRRLEDPVAASYRRLLEDASVHEARHSLIDRLLAAINERRPALHGHNRSAWERLY